MKNKLLALFVVVLSASGCAGWDIPAVTSLATVPNGDAIVLGQVKVIVNEVEPLREDVFGSSDNNYSGFIVSIVPEMGSTFWYWVAQKDGGEMYWHLPPGNYAVVALKYNHRASIEATRIIRPMQARFTIPNDEKMVYIGSLMITFNDMGSIASRSFGLHIEDRYENTLGALRRKFPEANGNVARRLMSL